MVDRALAVAILTSGCYHPTVAADVPCSDTGACPTGQHCDLGQAPPRCVTMDVDGAPADAPVDQPRLDAPADAAVAGSLVVTPTLLPNGDVNLTTEGTLDWVHWGLTTVASVDRKATGKGVIGTDTVVGLDTRKQATSVALTSSWTDGAPDAAATKSPTGIAFLGTTGVQVVVPAGTTPHTLRVYVGLKDTSARIDVALSDGSAPSYTNTQSAPSPTAVHLVYTIAFNTASDGQTVTVTWTDTGDLASDAIVELIDATLQ